MAAQYRALIVDLALKAPPVLDANVDDDNDSNIAAPWETVLVSCYRYPKIVQVSWGRELGKATTAQLVLVFSDRDQALKCARTFVDSSVDRAPRVRKNPAKHLKPNENFLFAHLLPLLASPVQRNNIYMVADGFTWSPPVGICELATVSYPQPVGPDEDTSAKPAGFVCIARLDNPDKSNSYAPNSVTRGYESAWVEHLDDATNGGRKEGETSSRTLISYLGWKNLQLREERLKWDGCRFSLYGGRQIPEYQSWEQDYDAYMQRTGALDHNIRFLLMRRFSRSQIDQIRQRDEGGCAIQ